jgi:hypothetical protein
LTVDRSRAPYQTQHALQASDLAAALNDSLKKLRIGPGDYVPELTSPQGPSTGGGVQAMQHLRLVPGQAGLPTLVVGHANRAEGRAELRNFEYVDAAHRQRFQRPVALDRAEYDAFMNTAKMILDALHLQTTIAGPPADLTSSATPGVRARGGSVLAVVVAVLALLVLAVATWAIFGRGSPSR